MKYISLIFITLTLISCEKRPEKYITPNNEFLVEQLFEVDGVKVYRFRDGGRTHYFANKTGSSTTSYHTKLVGETYVSVADTIYTD